MLINISVALHGELQVLSDGRHRASEWNSGQEGATEETFVDVSIEHFGEKALQSCLQGLGCVSLGLWIGCFPVVQATSRKL